MLRGAKMKKGILIIGLIIGGTLGVSACSTGEYNDLECDPAEYEAQCLSPNSYMYCKGGQLISVVCGGQRECKVDGNSVACKDPANSGHDNSVVNE